LNPPPKSREKTEGSTVGALPTILHTNVHHELAAHRVFTAVETDDRQAQRWRGPNPAGSTAAAVNPLTNGKLASFAATFRRQIQHPLCLGTDRHEREDNLTKDQDIGNSYWQEDVMTTIVAHSVINLGTILLVRIANHHADAFGLPRTWRADPRGKFRVRIVCGRHVDHAERLQRPDAIWSGACSSGGDKRRSCTFTLNGGASVTANVQ
jgi:hypothetical protein